MKKAKEFRLGEKLGYNNFRRSRYDRAIASSLQDWNGGTGAEPFNAQFMSAKLINVKKECRFPRHKHAFCEIFIPETGAYECEINGAKLETRPGEAVFAQTGDEHSDRYLAGSKFLIITIATLDVERKIWSHPIFAEKVPPKARIIKLDATPRLAKLGEALRAETPRQEAVHSLAGLCVAFFWEALSSLPDAQLSAEFKALRGGSIFLAKAYELFDKTPARDFDSKTLAAKLGMSKRSAELRFKTVFGLPPARVFMARKIEEAEGLLASGFSVKEAAEELGFANQFHFSRVFKRVAGRAPSAKRRI